ncbi:MAG: PLP-dependent transferase, partial [bacterium]|nr:PLP-dependent transferase [bacterium]
MPHDLDPSTIAVHAGRPARGPGQPVNTPVHLQSIQYSADSPKPGDPFYGRYGNPSWEGLEEVLGELEGAPVPAVAFSSGMAAIAAAFAILLPSGGRVVLPRHAYLSTIALAHDLAEKQGITVTQVDIADTAAVIRALDGAALLWLESPTNPMLEVADVPALVAAAREAGVTVVADNTFATPLVMRPLEHGVDVVVHSVTKYLAGHSDVVIGAVVPSTPELREKFNAHRTLYGSIPGPMESFLALRGMRTLALRVERSQASAAELAQRLSGHPGLIEVRHPSLPNDPGHARATEQMRGYGSILGIRVRGGATAADVVVGKTKLWLPATSLGGVESSLERRRRLAAEMATVPEDYVRLSVGIEDVEDLWRDLDQA